jgi:glycosyltransferase involved in cell wall biosynthesis
MSDFRISVIIPVYNAERFIKKAVESAVHLRQVAEVVLVEDGSPDRAIDVCRELQQQYPHVKVFQHRNGENRGAGASRNLGIQNSRSEYIAFLDADDWYLPNRFSETEEIFRSDDSVDGVYAPIGTFFTEENLKLFGKATSKQKGDQYITFFKKPIEPKRLFVELLTMRHGTFSTDGLVIKRKLLEKTGMFNENLKLHQDSELWVRCAYFGKLVGTVDPAPVAMRGVHQANRVNASNFKSRSLYFSALYEFFRNRKLTPEERKELERKYIHYHPKRKFHDSPALLQYLEKSVFWIAVKFNGFFTRRMPLQQYPISR